MSTNDSCGYLVGNTKPFIHLYTLSVFILFSVGFSHSQLLSQTEKIGVEYEGGLFREGKVGGEGGRWKSVHINGILEEGYLL